MKSRSRGNDSANPYMPEIFFYILLGLDNNLIGVPFQKGLSEFYRNLPTRHLKIIHRILLPWILGMVTYGDDLS